MSFLIDTDICSAHLKGHRAVASRFLQFSGGLKVSVVTVAELVTWSARTNAPLSRLTDLANLFNDMDVLPITAVEAQKFGELQAALLDSGKPAPGMDLLIAATALVHNLTVVTHNTQDYQYVPGLRLVDWLIP